jgi:hypothetical protein
VKSIGACLLGATIALVAAVPGRANAHDNHSQAVGAPLSGVVVAVSGNRVDLETVDGGTRTVVLGPSTVFDNGMRRADLRAGLPVSVETADGGSRPLARRISIDEWTDARAATHDSEDPWVTSEPRRRSSDDVPPCCRGDLRPSATTDVECEDSYRRGYDDGLRAAGRRGAGERRRVGTDQEDWPADHGWHEGDDRAIYDQGTRQQHGRPAHRIP